MARGYQLIKKIAGGGMGEVFVARLTGSENFEKHVALKLLLPHLASSSELVERFHDEARLAARMHHPNIVEIFDVGETEGRPFIAMQLVDGVTLSHLMKEINARGEQMPLPIARLIAVGLCEALTYAHNIADSNDQPLRVVHRDVTPSNVLVSRNGAVLLTDFGIARVRDGALTSPGVLRGKMAYLAPEQFLHHAPVDARADIYAAGLTLYEAIAGAHPHKRESTAESLAAIKRGDIPPIESVRVDVTSGIARGLTHALALNVEERLTTAKELREAFCDGPIASGPELADYVRRLCGERPPLEREFNFGPETNSIIGVTRTILDDGSHFENTAPDVLRPRGRRFASVAIVTLLALTALVVALWSRAEIDTSSSQTMPTEDATVFPVLAPPNPPQLTEQDFETKTQPDLTVPTSPPVAKQVAPTRKVESSKRSRKTVVAPRQVAPTPKPVGYLTADASPWAEVLVEGKVIDRTPFVRHAIPAGSYTLVFRAPDGTFVERKVTVTAGETTALRVEF